MIISHEPPDYPVMNLEVALKGQATHAECALDDCGARRYFDGLVPSMRQTHSEDEEFDD